MASYRVLIGTDPSAPEYSFVRADQQGRPVRVCSVDPVGATLSVDELTFAVRHENGDPIIFAPKDYDGILSTDGFLLGANDLTRSLQAVPYGTPVWLMQGQDLEAKYYFVHAEQTGENLFSVVAASPVGFLDRVQHLGGVYDAQTVGDLLQELIGDLFAYSCAAGIAEEPVRGWLPIDTARNNLHRMLYALGISVLRDIAGDVVFSYLDSRNAAVIPRNRIFLNGRINYSKPATVVRVTEHSYYKIDTTPEEELYNNSGQAAAMNRMVTFSEPCFALRAAGNLSISASGANYAVVSGTGTLYGKKYTHTTQVLQAGQAGAGEKVSTVSVENNGLITGLCGPSVLDRLYRYHLNKTEISTSLRLDGEKPGDWIRITDPEGAAAAGVLARAEIKYSTFPRAESTVITGYVPTGQGNTYNAVDVLTQQGTWTVPSGVSRVLAVAIGAGDGGAGGAAGQTAKGNDEGFDGGAGGAAGASGAPGRVYAVELEASPGDVIEVVPGVGGQGGPGGSASDNPDAGTVPGQPGAAGTATVIRVTHDEITTEYSSDMGLRPTAGYVNLIDGTVYALPGAAGYDGGAGNGPNADGGTVAGQWTPGANPSSMRMEYYWPASREFRFVGTSGYGGGAAYGKDGNPGERWTTQPPIVTEDQTVYDTPTSPTPLGGAGADGADPVPYNSQATIGTGGAGGHGGGGGGCGGNGYIGTSTTDLIPIRGAGGAGGKGGNGADGQTGGSGAGLIYYRRN